MDLDVLRQVPLFSSLPESEIEYLARTLHLREYPAGALLVREGAVGNAFYLVMDGQVEVIKALGTEAERLLSIVGAGSFLGEMSMFSRGGVHTASVRARTPVDILEMTRSDFDALLHRQPEIAYDMVRVLSLRLDESEELTIRDLLEKNRELKRAYDELKAAQAQLVEKERLEAELDVARTIQRSVLPRALPRLPRLELGVRMEPMLAMGGDFYDLFPMGEDRLGIAVGDVSGHGVPAAFFMALTYSLLRAEAGRTNSPGEALRNVNRHLFGMNNSGMFVTVLYGILNLVTREFNFARAGHELPLICCRGQGEMAELEFHSGQILGLFPGAVLDEQTVTLAPGDLVLLYTDGVNEAMNLSRQEFGLARLSAALEACGEMPAQAACDAIYTAVREHCGQAPQHDDILLLAIRQT